MVPRPRALDKAAFLDSRVCLARGWYLRRVDDSEPPSLADRMRMNEGMEVARRARLMYPDGVFASKRDEDSVGRTQQLVAEKAVPTLFEATFRDGELVARADILDRIPGGFKLLEVKSNLAPVEEDAPPREDLVQDLAYTTMVALRAGVPVKKASLLLLSRDFRLGMPDADLFLEIDCSEMVLPVAKVFEGEADATARATGNPKRPPVKLLKECGGCPFFESDCLGKGMRNAIFDLPHLSAKRFGQLAEIGVMNIADIPSDFELTNKQAVVREAVRSGKQIVDQNSLRSLLAQVKSPTAFLDFETCKWAIPIFQDVAPHEQIATQFSVHLCDRPGNVIAHFEYLADHDRDCRQELAARLCDALEQAKTIVSYSAFEKRVLNELAQAFPKSAKKLKEFTERLFDLEAACKPEHCYHPQFHGRSSIKRTLPVLVPDLSYDGLPIADGDTAVAQFAKMASGTCSHEEIEAIRRDLLAYCKLDTLGMVRLHERLTRLC